MTEKKKRKGAYSNCASYHVDDTAYEMLPKNDSGKKVKTIYFLRPANNKEGFKEDQRDFRVDRYGDFRSPCFGLYKRDENGIDRPIYTRTKAEEAVLYNKAKMKSARHLNYELKHTKRPMRTEAGSDDEVQQFHKRDFKKSNMSPPVTNGKYHKKKSHRRR